MTKIEARWLAAGQLVVLVSLNVAASYSLWFVVPVVLAGFVLGTLLASGLG